jgi:hypothetical protein
VTSPGRFFVPPPTLNTHTHALGLHAIVIYKKLATDTRPLAEREWSRTPGDDPFRGSIVDLRLDQPGWASPGATLSNYSVVDCPRLTSISWRSTH